MTFEQLEKSAHAEFHAAMQSSDKARIVIATVEVARLAHAYNMAKHGPRFVK